MVAAMEGMTAVWQNCSGTAGVTAPFFTAAEEWMSHQAAAMLMTHGFWHGRASSSSCLPCWPALRGFFLLPKKVCEWVLWVLWAFDATAFGTESIYSLYALYLQEPQQVGVPKEHLCHRQDSLEFSLPTPPTAGGLSWNCCCLPELGPLGAEGPLLFSDELFWNPTYNLMIFGFSYYLLEAVLVVFPSKKQLFSQSLKI